MYIITITTNVVILLYLMGEMLHGVALTVQGAQNFVTAFILFLQF